MTTVKRTLTLFPEDYAICRLPPDKPIPAWAISNQASFFSVTRSPDELSIICPQHQVPGGIVAEMGWRCLKLNGPFDLDEPGVLASVVTPLADAGLSVFAVATYDTDYLLVQKLDPAIAALEKAAYSIIQEHKQ
jgi:hypothetical protein